MLRMRWGKKASPLKRIIKVWNSCPRKWERVQTLDQQKDFQVTSKAVITLKPYMCKGAHHQSQTEYRERRLWCWFRGGRRGEYFCGRSTVRKSLSQWQIIEIIDHIVQVRQGESEGVGEVKARQTENRVDIKGINSQSLKNRFSARKQMRKVGALTEGRVSQKPES